MGFQFCVEIEVVGLWLPFQMSYLLKLKSGAVHNKQAKQTHKHTNKNESRQRAADVRWKLIGNCLTSSSSTSEIDKVVSSGYMRHRNLATFPII